MKTAIAMREDKPMAEYITKEAAIQAFEWGEADVIEDYGDGYNFGFSRGIIKSAINAIPAADVAPVVHGRWMHEETEGGFHIWRCSRCGRGMNDNPEGIDLYCYHCGAKMDGGNS